MSDLPNGRANQRAGLRKEESLRKVDQIAMAAIRSSAEGMAQQESQGLVEGGHLAVLVFRKWHCVRMELREKTFDSWRELRNELSVN